MSEAKVAYQRYGKCKTRVIRVVRESEFKHQVKEIDVTVLLEGAFDDAYYKGDNSLVIPTDTVKNTIYVLAKKHSLDPIEDYSLLLCSHFFSKYSHVTGIHIVIEEVVWTRLTVQGKPHGHAFQKTNPYVRFCRLEASRSSANLVSGVKEFLLMKSTNSGFEGFHRDDHTSLQDTRDRFVKSSIYAEWTYSKNWMNRYLKNILKDDKQDRDQMRPQYNSFFEKVKQSVVEEFAGNPETGIYAPSVQQTLYMAGRSVLQRIPEVDAIFIAMPNLHCFLFDYSRLPKLGLTNKNEVFFPSDEPHGEIEALIVRSEFDKERHKIPPTPKPKL